MDDDGGMVEIWPPKRRRVGSSPQRRLTDESRTNPTTQFHPPPCGVSHPRQLSESQGHLPSKGPTCSVSQTCRLPEQNFSACPTEHPPEDLTKRRAAVSHETRESLFCGQSDGSSLADKSSRPSSSCRIDKPKKVLTDLERKKIKLDGLQKWYSRSSLDTGPSSSSQSSTSWLQRFRRKKSNETPTSMTTQDSFDDVGRGTSDEAVSRCPGAKEAVGSVDSSELDCGVRGTDAPKSIDDGLSQDSVQEAGTEGCAPDEDVRMVGLQESGSIDCSEPDGVSSKSVDSTVCEEAPPSEETTKMVRTTATPQECIDQNTSTTDFNSRDTAREAGKPEEKKTVKFPSLENTVASEVQTSVEDARIVCEGDEKSGFEDKTITDSKNALPDNPLPESIDNVDDKCSSKALETNTEVTDQASKQDGLTNTEETRNVAAREIDEPNENVTLSEEVEGSHHKSDFVPQRLDVTEANRPEEPFGVTITVGDPGTQANSMTYLASSEAKLIHSFKIPFDVPGGGFQQNLIVICPQDPSQAPTTELNHEPMNKATANPLREVPLDYVPTRQLQERDGKNQLAENPVTELRSGSPVSTADVQQERDSKNQSTQNPVTELQSDKELSTVDLKQAQNDDNQPTSSPVTELVSQQELAPQQPAPKAMDDDNKPSTENRVADLGLAAGQDQTPGANSPAAGNKATEPRKQEESGPISTSPNCPSHVPEKKDQVIQMVKTTPQNVSLAQPTKVTCNKASGPAKKTGKTTTRFSGMSKSDLKVQEICEAVLAVWKRNKTNPTQRDLPKKESSLQNQSRAMRNTVITQWEHAPRDYRGSSTLRGQDSYYEAPPQHNFQKVRHQEPALSAEKVQSSSQEKGQVILRSRAATQKQFSPQKNDRSTTRELRKEIQYPKLKSPRYSSFYENCQEELERWKASFNEKASSIRNNLSFHKDAALHFARSETAPRRTCPAPTNKQEVITSSRESQVGSRLATHAELTVPSTSNQKTVPTKSKKVLSWDVPGGDFPKSPTKVFTSLKFPSPEQPRQCDTHVLSDGRVSSRTKPQVPPPGSSRVAETIRSGYDTALGQPNRAMPYASMVAGQVTIDPFSSDLTQTALSDLSGDDHLPRQAPDSSEKKNTQLEKKSTIERSTSCFQVQRQIRSFQSLKKELPGIDWTPIHIESRLPLSFLKAKNNRSSLPKTEDGVGTPLRRASNRVVLCGTGESTCSSVGKKTYTPCFAPRSSIQKNSPQGSKNSSLLSENSSSLGSSCSGTPRNSSDNSGRNDELTEPGGIGYQNSNYRGLASTDREFAKPTSPEYVVNTTPPLAGQHSFHKQRVHENDASFSAEVASRMASELPDLSPKRSRSGGEIRLRHHRTSKSFSRKESIQSAELSRTSSKSHMSAEDLRQKEDETLRYRSSHRNYKACSFEPPLQPRVSKTASPPRINPWPPPLPTALPGTSSQAAASMVAPDWSSPPLLEHQMAALWPQKTLGSSSNFDAQSLLETSSSFPKSSASHLSPQRMHVVFPIDVPVTSSPGDNLQCPAYESEIPPPDLPSTSPSADQEDVSQSTLVEPVDAFSDPTCTEALPPDFPPSLPLPPEPPPFDQPSISVSISSLENAPRPFPRAPGQQPVSLVFIPVPTVCTPCSPMCTPCPCPSYLPSPQSDMVPEALAVPEPPEPRGETCDPTGEWIVEEPQRDLEQAVYEDSIREQMQQAPPVQPYPRMDAKEEEKGKPEEQDEREEKDKKETGKRKPARGWTGIMAVLASLQFLQLLAIAFALAAAMDVAKDLYQAKPNEKLLHYKHDLRGAGMAPRRLFVPYDSSFALPKPTSPSPGKAATEPMRPTPSVQNTSTVREPFSGFLPRRLLPGLPQESNRTQTNKGIHQSLSDKTSTRSLIPTESQNNRPYVRGIVEEAASSVTPYEENYSSSAQEIIGNGTTQYVARNDHRAQPVTESDEIGKVVTEIVDRKATEDRGERPHLAQHGNASHENRPPGPTTSVPQPDLPTALPSPQYSTTSSGEMPVPKSEQPDELESPVSTRIEASKHTSAPTFSPKSTDASVSIWKQDSTAGDALKPTSRENPENSQVFGDPETLPPDKMKLKKKSRYYIPKTGDMNKHLDKKSKEKAKLNISDVESVHFKAPRKRQVYLHSGSGDIYDQISKAVKRRSNSRTPREAKYRDDDDDNRNFDAFSDRAQEIFSNFDEEAIAEEDDRDWDSREEDYKEVKRKKTEMVAPKSDADASYLPEKRAKGRFFEEIRVTVKDMPEGDDSSQGVTKAARRKKPKHRKTDGPSTATTNKDPSQGNDHSSTEKSTFASTSTSVQDRSTAVTEATGTIDIPTSSSETGNTPLSSTISITSKTSIRHGAQTTVELSPVTKKTTDVPSSALGGTPWTESQIDSPEGTLTSKATTIAPPSQDTSIPRATSTTEATHTTWQPSPATETSTEVQTSTQQSEPSQIQQNTSPIPITPPSAETLTTSPTAPTETQELVPPIEPRKAPPRASPATGTQNIAPGIDLREVTPAALPSTQNIVPRFDIREVTPVAVPSTKAIAPRMGDPREITPVPEPTEPTSGPRDVTAPADSSPGGPPGPGPTTEPSDSGPFQWRNDALDIPWDRFITEAAIDFEILFLTVFILCGYAALLLLQIFIAFNGGRNVCRCAFVLFALVWFILAGGYFFYRDRKILAVALLYTAFLFLISAIFLIFASRLRA